LHRDTIIIVLKGMVTIMAKDLRGTWKETGVGLGHAFRDLGKTLIKTGATAVKKVDAWANKEDYAEEEPKTEDSTKEEGTSEENN